MSIGMRAGGGLVLGFVMLASAGSPAAQDAARALQELWATTGIKLVAPFIQIDAVARPHVAVRLLTEDGGLLMFTAASFNVESAEDGLKIVPKGPGTILVYAEGRTMRAQTAEVFVTSDGWARFAAHRPADIGR
jgi:hypothetical protein